MIGARELLVSDATLIYTEQRLETPISPYSCAPIKNITCYYLKILRINIRGAPVYIDVPRQCMCSKREGKKSVGDGSYGVTIYFSGRKRK